MSKPLLLDLFCGAGGASVGYHRAGFEVVGVDIKPQPNYPFELHQGDALTVLGALLNGLEGPSLEKVEVIHASPPCQSYSRHLRHMAHPQEMLVDEVLRLLDLFEEGPLWVVENVVGAPLPNQDTLDGRHGIELCGTQFGLNIGRHRLFESNISLATPLERCRCSEQHLMNPYHSGGRKRLLLKAARQDKDLAEVLWREEMGVEWMGRYEGRESIPPAYTEFIGKQLMAHLKATVAA